MPNAMAPLIVQLSFLFAYAVLTEATLSFLGVGAVPPTPTWGNIMAEGRQYMIEAPWIIAIPGAALMVTVLGLNLLGDGLRDVLDPRSRLVCANRPAGLCQQEKGERPGEAGDP
jgi:peptide/nickel transport system permease protein